MANIVFTLNPRNYSIKNIFQALVQKGTNKCLPSLPEINRQPNSSKKTDFYGSDNSDFEWPISRKAQLLDPSTAKINAKNIVNRMFRDAKIAAGLDPDAPTYGIQRTKFMEDLCQCIVFVLCDKDLTLDKARKTLYALNRKFKNRAGQLFTEKEARGVGDVMDLLRKIFKLKGKGFQIWDQGTKQTQKAAIDLLNCLKRLENLFYDEAYDWLRQYIEWPGQDEGALDGYGSS